MYYAATHGTYCKLLNTNTSNQQLNAYNNRHIRMDGMARVVRLHVLVWIWNALTDQNLPESSGVLFQQKMPGRCQWNPRLYNYRM